MKKPFLFGALLAFWATGTVSALQIIGENATENYRFTSGYPGSPVPNTDPAFFGDGLDLSGIGWGSNASQSFVMINDQYFLYATHYPPIGSSMNFYSDAVGGVVTYTIDGSFNLAFEYPFQAMGTHLKSDLSLGRLTTTVNPAHDIAAYPILDLPLASYEGLDLLVYGWNAAIGDGQIDDLVAGNLYWNAGTPAVASDDVLNTLMNSDVLFDTPLIEYTQGLDNGQALLEGGDSGSPSFVVWNGSLALVGVHSAVNGTTNYDVFVPAYQTALTDAGIAYTTVPEPSAAFLLLGGLAIAVSRRVRRV
jgi:hypothetical protein